MTQTKSSEGDIPIEFLDAKPVQRFHRYMITDDGNIYFGFLGIDGVNNYFMASPELTGALSLELCGLATAGQRIKDGDPSKSVNLPFSCNAVFTLIPKGNGTTGSIEFHFLTHSGTTLTTLISPALASQMSSQLIHVLSTIPTPPSTHELSAFHSKVKGTPHTGKDTKLYFGQNYNKDILQIIGVLIIRANLLEAALVRLLAVLLEVVHEKAAAIFYSSQNMRARSDMLQAALSVSKLSSNIIDQVTKELTKVNAISRRRNQLVHGEWEFHGERFNVRKRKALPSTSVQPVIESYKSIEAIAGYFHDTTVILDLLSREISEKRP